DHLLLTTHLHSGNASAAAVQIAHDIARHFLRREDLDVHYRLKQRRFGFFHRRTERLAARCLERMLVGVNRVITPIYERYFEIDERIPCDGSRGGGLENAFFYRGPEVLRNGAAKDL